MGIEGDGVAIVDAFEQWAGYRAGIADGGFITQKNISRIINFDSKQKKMESGIEDFHEIY